MQKNSVPAQHNELIKLAFSASTLEVLIRAGKLHAADFHCLDEHSKKGVWALLRSLAARNRFC